MWFRRPRGSVAYRVGMGGGGHAPPRDHLSWLAAAQRAQGTAYQQIFHRPDWVNSWNFMNKQLKNVLYLTYSSFYSQKTSCFTVTLPRSCEDGHGQKIRAHFAHCFSLAPPTLCMLWVEPSLRSPRALRSSKSYIYTVLQLAWEHIFLILSLNACKHGSV
jgi:hypothetical protein